MMKRSLRSWLWGVPLNQEVDEELQFHIAMRTRELIERGMDPKTAREIVLSRIGDLGQLKFRAVLVGTFATVALVLAMIGVFGVFAYSVQQRMREFGVRVAMGARMRDVLRLVLAGAARLTGIGIVIGLATAAALGRFLATLVFPVTPLDPVTFAVVPIVLIATAAIAVAAPAWRAARVDPVVAFRNE
jgi:ABC-type antimicrobial peptide transport system permease subunit